MAGMRDTLNSSNHEGNPVVSVVFKIFSAENVWAILLFLIVIALVVFTTDSSPAWIYQGF